MLITGVQTGAVGKYPTLLRHKDKMPIYNFRCPECLKEEEKLLPMADRDVSQVHSCGFNMERLISLPGVVIVPLTGRDISLKTLNKEEGHDFPTRERDRPRMERVLAKGLDQRPPTIGIGFG